MPALPGYETILDLATRPNALLLLAVEHRERSWSSFLAWLLDPGRSGPLASCATQALATVLRDHPSAREPHEHTKEALSRFVNSEPSPLWSQAEVRHGQSRFDVLAGFKTRHGNVRVLIENKIRAGESTKQMHRYEQDARHGMLPETVLLPLFVALGSEPPAMTSCPWAIVLERTHARRFLVEVQREAVSTNLPCPPLVQDYVDLFQLWTLTDELRRTHGGEIEAVKAGPEAPPGWSRVKRWLDVGNDAFYAAVRSSPTLVETFSRFKMRSSTFRSPLGQSTSLQIYGEGWSIGKTLLEPKGVDIHYESAHRGELFIHVEISPYEGGLDTKPGRVAELKAPLASKATIQKGIRERTSALAGCSSWMGATLARCGDPDHPSTLAAIKFRLKNDKREVTPEECAAYFARIIEATADIITEEIEAERARLSARSAIGVL